MSEIEQRSVIHFYYKKGKTPQQIHPKLVAVYEKDAYTLKSVEYWYHQFKCGRNNVDDASKTGRPPLDDVDARILSTLNDYPFATLSMLSDACNCSIGTIYNHLTNILGYKNYTLQWVPYFLTDELKEKRLKGANELKAALIEESKKDFQKLITGDQSWFFLTYEPRNKWSLSAEEVPNRVSKAIHTQKVMITIMFTKHELLLVDLLPQGQSFNSEYFISNVMIPTLQRFQEVTGRKKAKLHLDNCRVHNSKKSYEWYNLNHIIRIPHPPYSPDLAPSDFFLFGYIKNKLAGRSFDSPTDLFEAIIEIVNSIPKETFDKVFKSWIERCDKIIRAKGYYI